MFGEQDDRVTRGEIDAVYKTISSPKELHTFPLAGHNDYLIRYGNDWNTTVNSFLARQVY